MTHSHEKKNLTETTPEEMQTLELLVSYGNRLFVICSKGQRNPWTKNWRNQEMIQEQNDNINKEIETMKGVQQNFWSLKAH